MQDLNKFIFIKKDGCLYLENERLRTRQHSYDNDFISISAPDSSLIALGTEECGVYLMKLHGG
jgi:hypothetical protein